MKREVLNIAEELASLGASMPELLTQALKKEVIIKEDGTVIADGLEVSEDRWKLIKRYLQW